MAKRRLTTAEIVVLISDSDSSEGHSEDYIPDRWHEESSSEDNSSDDEDDTPRREKKHGRIVKVRNHVQEPSGSHNHASENTQVDCVLVCDGQVSEAVYKWTASNMIQPTLPRFTATVGCRVNTENFSPIDYFQLFLDDEFFERIVQQTNLYADQNFCDHEEMLGPNVRARQWTATNLSEMRKFWGLTLQMGVVQKPSIDSYWSTKNNPVIPIFHATMSSDRFLLLQKYLHYNDNTLALPQDHPQFDDLFKLRPVLDYLMKRFQEVYTPGQNIVAERSWLLYKGRIVSKQYVPKRERYGRLHRLCESSNGYTYRFRVCINKDPHLISPQSSSDFRVNEKIVEDLVRPLFNQGYHLYMDQVYTGLALFKLLYSNSTLACGKIRPTRNGFPRELKGKKQKKGETSLRRCEELLAVKYTGNKDEHLLTTIHDESTLTFAMEEEPGQATKPKCLLDYNYYMAGVDRSGHMLEPFIAPRKAMVWYKKLVVHLVQLSMFNAFVVYHQTTSEKRLSFPKFQESVINSLLANTEASIDVVASQNEDRLTGRHFPDLIPPTKKTNPCRRCRVCSQHGQRRETRYYCPECPSKPALCITACFRTYHTKETY